MKTISGIIAILLLLCLFGTSASPAHAENVLIHLEHGGLERNCTVHLPAEYNPQKRYPLLVFVHGAGGDAVQAMEQTGFAALADREGFIAAFPEGTGLAEENRLTWNAWYCCGYAKENAIDDTGFLRALIEHLKKAYPVNERRVYMAGFSNGAMLTHRFAQLHSDVLAGIAVVSGGMPCDVEAPDKPLPVIIIHGVNDRMARFDASPPYKPTGEFCMDEPLRHSLKFWLSANSCSETPQLRKSGNVTLNEYSCKSGVKVAFYVLSKAGHAWPGGKKVKYRYCVLPTNDLDATRVIWDFFRSSARR